MRIPNTKKKAINLNRKIKKNELNNFKINNKRDKTNLFLRKVDKNLKKTKYTRKNE